MHTATKIYATIEDGRDTLIISGDLRLLREFVNGDDYRTVESDPSPALSAQQRAERELAVPS